MRAGVLPARWRVRPPTATLTSPEQLRRPRLAVISGRGGWLSRPRSPVPGPPCRCHAFSSTESRRERRLHTLKAISAAVVGRVRPAPALRLNVGGSAQALGPRPAVCAAPLDARSLLCQVMFARSEVFGMTSGAVMGPVLGVVLVAVFLSGAADGLRTRRLSGPGVSDR